MQTSRNKMQMNQVLQHKKEMPYPVKAAESTPVLDAVDMTKRIVRVVYNTSLFYDKAQDIILPGAVTKSITERGPNSSAVQKIKHLMDHMWDSLTMPGKIVALEEGTYTNNGKTYQGIISEIKMANTSMGDNVLINYQEGIYDNHSIGYQYVEGEYVDETMADWTKWLNMCVNPDDMAAMGYAFIWKELKLYEGSTTPFGCNSLTPMLGVKSMSPDLILIKLHNRMDLLTKQLRSGTQTDDMMQSFEMEIAQIKQIQIELFALHPDEKDTLKQKGRQAASNESEGINISNILKCF